MLIFERRQDFRFESVAQDNTTNYTQKANDMSEKVRTIKNA